MNVYVCLPACVCVNVCVCVCLCACVCVRALMCVCLHACACVCVLMCVLMCVLLLLFGLKIHTLICPILSVSGTLCVCVCVCGSVSLCFLSYFSTRGTLESPAGLSLPMRQQTGHGVCVCVGGGPCNPLLTSPESQFAPSLITTTVRNQSDRTVRAFNQSALTVWAVKPIRIHCQLLHPLRMLVTDIWHLLYYIC